MRTPLKSSSVQNRRQMVSDDPFEDPEWLDFARQARENLVPMIDKSAVAVSIVSDKLDPKLAIETGYMVLMDKPIILAVTPGSKIPSKLALVADEIVEVDLSDPSFSDRLRAAIQRVTERLDL